MGRDRLVGPAHPEDAQLLTDCDRLRDVCDRQRRSAIGVVVRFNDNWVGPDDGAYDLDAFALVGGPDRDPPRLGSRTVPGQA